MAQSGAAAAPPDVPLLWKVDSFGGLLADPFIGGTELETGHIANAVQVTLPSCSSNPLFPSIHPPHPTQPHPLPSTSTVPRSQIIQLLFGQLLDLPAAELQQRLSLLQSPENLRRLRQGIGFLNGAREMTLTAYKEVQDPEKLAKFVQDWLQKLQGLGVGEALLCPAGWNGLTQRGTVMFLIQRGKLNDPQSRDGYSFSVINAGGNDSILYHPSMATEDPEQGMHPRLKYKTCLTLSAVPRERLMQPGMWTLIFKLWLKQPASEYNRLEVLYDVILPWLVDMPLPEALLQSQNLLQADGVPADDPEDWHTPSRSNAGATRCVMAALRHIYRLLGFSSAQLDQLDFAIQQLALEQSRVQLRTLHSEWTTYRAKLLEAKEKAASGGDAAKEEVETPAAEPGVSPSFCKGDSSCTSPLHP